MRLWLTHGLKRRAKLETFSIVSDFGTGECLSTTLSVGLNRQRLKVSKPDLEEPTRDELSVLTLECFPPIEESRVIITEYSQNALRKSEYTLGEVLASNHILQPGDLVRCVRWIYVEYYKMGTFWGSDHRFSQWGTDPVLFEKSPISLLQDRLAELDRQAGRPSLEEEDIPGKQRKSWPLRFPYWCLDTDAQTTNGLESIAVRHLDAQSFSDSALIHQPGSTRSHINYFSTF